MPPFKRLALAVLGLWTTLGASDDTGPNSCPGYKASNVKKSATRITADLTLAGDACNLYSKDIKNLKLNAEYQTDKRFRVKIYDADEEVFQIPSTFLSLPSGEGTSDSELEFSLTESPFSFSVTRKSNGQKLFDTAGQALVFETQYSRLRTALPKDPNIYGLGEHADPFRHDPSNYSHTNWNAGEPFMPQNANLYGHHPVYYDHRGTEGTHAVYFHNSNGQRIHLNEDSEGNYLEINTIGGVLDFYFFAGSTPKEASKQYGELIGKPVMMPYWSFGFHQCRYGYFDAYDTAAVAANYSAAKIPLETLWNDIDYMDHRGTFSVDPVRFPVHRMRELVDYLHDHDQHYIMMLDPAVAARDYPPYNNGVEMDALVKEDNGTVYTGIVWPGPTSYPDWYSPKVQAYWDREFNDFFSADHGVDIDGLWIDMNEPANFIDYPCCADPEKAGIEGGSPPRPPPARMSSPYDIPGLGDDFQQKCFVTVKFSVNGISLEDSQSVILLGNTLSMGNSTPFFAPEMAGHDGTFDLTVQLPADENVTYSYPLYTRKGGQYKFEKKNRTLHTGSCGSNDDVSDTFDPSAITEWKDVPLPDGFKWKPAHGKAPPTHSSEPSGGLADRDLISPKYDIKNFFGNLSSQTLPTNLHHANGLVEYDVHSMFSSLMGKTSRKTLIQRRPGRRPFIITRSSYAGDGAHLGHWFGDNRAIDDDYRLSIVQMIQFPALYQMPIVGSDVCGFNYDTNPTLCARWAVLGSWNPFMRNHAELSSIRQEFYLWDNVAAAARKALRTRYMLLDYTYTALHEQTTSGAPMLTPLLWQYPEDKATNAIDLQFFFGEALLVSPVTEPNATSVEFYMPNDTFYDFDTLEKVDKSATGAKMTRDNVGYDEIPVHFRGGHIVPMREDGAMTTTALRKKDFVLYIAPDEKGKAEGSLYLDDGDSLEPEESSLIKFSYADGRLVVEGTFGYDPKVSIVSVTVLGVDTKPKNAYGIYDEEHQTLVKKVKKPLTEKFSLNLLP